MKTKKWLKFRHRVVRNIAYIILWPYCRIRYGITVEKFSTQEKRPYFILFNHQTAFDQFFVGMAFKGPVYYVASDDLFSNGFISKLIRWLVEPIPIKKQATDISAVMNCMRVAKEGGTIAIAPEGNRTYSGKTEYMNSAIIPLIKKLKLPVVLYRIEGGYGVHPRWSDVLRKGKMRSYVYRVIMPEEYKDMSNDQLFDEVKAGLFVNEGVSGSPFSSKKKAEYLERAMYVCPFCGLSRFESNGDVIHCKKCGVTVKYNEDRSIIGVDRQFPFGFVNDWYEYQQSFVRKLDVNDYIDTPAYTETVEIRKVIAGKGKQVIAKCAEVSLYGNRITVDNLMEFSFDEIGFSSVLGRNKLNVYYQDSVYQFKGNKRFNAVKYVNMYYHYKNVMGENTNGEFLGL